MKVPDGYENLFTQMITPGYTSRKPSMGLSHQNCALANWLTRSDEYDVYLMKGEMKRVLLHYQKWKMYNEVSYWVQLQWHLDWLYWMQNWKCNVPYTALFPNIAFSIANFQVGLLFEDTQTWKNTWSIQIQPVAESHVRCR